MKSLLSSLFAAALALAAAMPLGAAEPAAPGLAGLSPIDSACVIDAKNHADDQAPGHLRTAQVSQTDCCKGHKGICGCRAGKIVCCDNTISPTCTCHSDWNPVY